MVLRRIALSMTVAWLLAPEPALADQREVGKVKSALCAACHGSDGIAVLPMYPNLAGQQQQYLEISLKAYRDGKRRHNLMSPMAAGLSDADIRALAAFYASLPAAGR